MRSDRHQQALPAPESPLVRRGASELAELIRTGEVSAREAVQAHIDRIEQVNGHINAVVAPRLEQALAEAALADERCASGQPLGPLHGVPVTIKDCFHVAGLATTLGLTRLRANVQSADSPLVARLKGAGAIVLGKTNVPQLMMLHECDNPLFGRTNNPADPQRTSGGSSGGEAAAIAAYCSPLGLGNDTGGSIRWPAHACGVCGFKPTSRRLTRRGEMAALRGMEAVWAVSGPLARSVADVIAAMRVLTDSRTPRTTEIGEVPLPLGDPRQVDLKQLRVGYWLDDGFFTPSPAIARAVREAAAALKAEGVQVVEFQPPDIQQAMHIYLSLLSADGSRDARRLLAGSTRDRRISRLILLARMPSLVRVLACGALGALGHRHAARLLRYTGAQSASGYWELCHRRNQYAEQFWEAARKGELDAFVMPPFGLTAYRHGHAAELLPAGSYAFLMNLLDAPSGVVPWTRVGPGEECAERNRRDYIERAANASELGSQGMPVGVQIAAWPWRDDVALRLMQAVEAARPA